MKLPIGYEQSILPIEELTEEDCKGFRMPKDVRPEETDGETPIHLLGLFFCLCTILWATL